MQVAAVEFDTVEEAHNGRVEAEKVAEMARAEKGGRDKTAATAAGGSGHSRSEG